MLSYDTVDFGLYEGEIIKEEYNLSVFLLAVESKGSDLFHILFPVVFVKTQGLLLCGTLNVWLIFEQLLDPCKYLLDCDVWLPVFFLVENRQTNCSGWIYVGMRQDRFEHTFWRSTINIKVPNWVVMREVHSQDVAAGLPRTVLGTRYLTVPFQHVDGTVRVFDWLGHEAKRMVASPFLAFLFESVDD